MLHFLSSIGAFAAHLIAAVALAGAFVVIYIRTTPHDEQALVQQGNAAAAIGLAGALIGYAIALSRAISYSDGLIETMVWGLIALTVQIAGHLVLSRFMPRLYEAIHEGDLAAAITKAAVAIALGLVNAASMTP